MLAAYFCHSRQPQVEYNCALIKVDWLAACIALKKEWFALYFSFSSCVGVQFAQYASQMESKDRYRKRCPKPCWQLRSNGNLDEVQADNIKEVLRRENQGLKVYPVDRS
jgi:hypothetical protein